MPIFIWLLTFWSFLSGFQACSWHRSFPYIFENDFTTNQLEIQAFDYYDNVVTDWYLFAGKTLNLITQPYTSHLVYILMESQTITSKVKIVTEEFNDIQHVQFMQGSLGTKFAVVYKYNYGVSIINTGPQTITKTFIRRSATTMMSKAIFYQSDNLYLFFKDEADCLNSFRFVSSSNSVTQMVIGQCGGRVESAAITSINIVSGTFLSAGYILNSGGTRYFMFLKIDNSDTHDYVYFKQDSSFTEKVSFDNPYTISTIQPISSSQVVGCLQDTCLTSSFNSAKKSIKQSSTTQCYQSFGYYHYNLSNSPETFKAKVLYVNSAAVDKRFTQMQCLGPYYNYNLDQSDSFKIMLQRSQSYTELNEPQQKVDLVLVVVDSTSLDVKYARHITEFGGINSEHVIIDSYQAYSSSSVSLFILGHYRATSSYSAHYTYFFTKANPSTTTSSSDCSPKSYTYENYDNFLKDSSKKLDHGDFKESKVYSLTKVTSSSLQTLEFITSDFNTLSIGTDISLQNVVITTENNCANYQRGIYQWDGHQREYVCVAGQNCTLDFGKFTFSCKDSKIKYELKISNDLLDYQTSTSSSSFAYNLSTKWENKGVYSVSLTISSQDTNSDPIQLILPYTLYVLDPNYNIYPNKAPYFEYSLQSKYFVYGHQYQYKLPTVRDLENDQVEVKVDLGQSTVFTTFNAKQQIFKFFPNATNWGTYNIKIKLCDTYSVYNFQVSSSWNDQSSLYILNFCNSYFLKVSILSQREYNQNFDIIQNLTKDQEADGNETYSQLD